MCLAKHGNGASLREQKTKPKMTNIKRTQRLSISQPLEVYCPTSKHNPTMTPVHTSPFPRLRLATPLSDVAVAVADPVAVTVVLAPASVLEGNSELVPVARLVPTSDTVVAGGPALEVTDVV